uniref:Uncharacterized protein n=1 Tax=Panagrolaimus davidi TaxID=227884 RepID=A0A914QHR9_9BILA
MRTQILIDWIALAFVAILTIVLIVLSVVTLIERDPIDGKIMCTKDYTEAEMNAFKNSTDTKFLSCPTVFKTTMMRTPCVETLCNCTR